MKKHLGLARPSGRALRAAFLALLIIAAIFLPLNPAMADNIENVTVNDSVYGSVAAAVYDPAPLPAACCSAAAVSTTAAVYAAAIAGFTCNDYADTDAKFTWPAPVGATQVAIQQSLTGQGSWVTANAGGIIPVTATSATVTGLAPATAYDFRLSVTGGVSAGSSNQVSVTTKASPVFGIRLLSQQVKVGDTLYVEILLDNAEYKITGLDFELNFDSHYLEYKNFDKNTTIYNGDCISITNTDENSFEFSAVWRGYPEQTYLESYSGTRKLGTIAFRVIKAGEVHLIYSKTLIADIILPTKPRSISSGTGQFQVAPFKLDDLINTARLYGTKSAAANWDGSVDGYVTSSDWGLLKENYGKVDGSRF